MQLRLMVASTLQTIFKQKFEIKYRQIFLGMC